MKDNNSAHLENFTTFLGKKLLSGAVSSNRKWLENLSCFLPMTKENKGSIFLAANASLPVQCCPHRSQGTNGIFCRNWVMYPVRTGLLRSNLFCSYKSPLISVFQSIKVVCDPWLLWRQMTKKCIKMYFRQGICKHSIILCKTACKRRNLSKRIKCIM